MEGKDDVSYPRGYDKLKTLSMCNAHVLYIHSALRFFGEMGWQLKVTNINIISNTSSLQLTFTPCVNIVSSGRKLATHFKPLIVFYSIRFAQVTF